MWVRTMYLNARPYNRKENKIGSRVSAFRIPAIGRSLCQPAFRILLGVDANTLSTRTRVSEDSAYRGAWPGEHGLAGRSSNKKTDQLLVEQVVSFVLAFAEQEGEPDLETPEEQHGRTALILPSTSGNQLFAAYEESLRDQLTVKRTKFLTIFRKDPRLAHISAGYKRKRSDLDELRPGTADPRSPSTANSSTSATASTSTSEPQHYAKASRVE
mmetsp:Transcript_1662/g.5159  ORF Transcript_1662/g.5159 Transcript_1662/m.5159 type:complete len:214 (+) Transcript_1662:233-874(+)